MAEPTGLNEVTTKGKIRLPLWGWGVVGLGVAGGGLLIYLRHRKSAAAAAAAAAQPAAPDPTAASAGFSTPTTILPIFQGTQPATPATPSASGGIPSAIADLNMGSYTVTGRLAYYSPASLGGTPAVTDAYPSGVAAIVYGLAGNPHNPDIINIASQLVFITLANPGKIPPYPKGTVLQYPIHPETLTPAAASAQLSAGGTVVPNRTIPVQ